MSDTDRFNVDTGDRGGEAGEYRRGSSHLERAIEEMETDPGLLRRQERADALEEAREG